MNDLIWMIYESEDSLAIFWTYQEINDEIVFVLIGLVFCFVHKVKSSHTR